MKRFFFLVFLLIGCQNPSTNKELNTPSNVLEKSEDKPTEIKPSEGSTGNQSNAPKKFIEIGYWSAFEKLPELTFEESTMETFRSAQQNHPKLSLESFNSIPNNLIGNVDHILDSSSCNQTNSGFCFKNYLPNQKFYIGESYFTGESIGFGDLYIIDSLTNIFYQITSIGDGSVSQPIFSPNNEYAIYFDNSVYQRNVCEIRLLKVNKRENDVRLFSELMHGRTGQFKIDSIKWMNDTSAVFKGTEEYQGSSDWVSRTKYYHTYFAKN